MFIKPTEKASGSIFDVNEELMMDLLLYPAHEDIPCPWDPDVIVEGDKVIIVGSITGGSSNTYKTAGYCRCECSISNFSNLYKLEIPSDDEEILAAAKEAGWTEA